MRRLRSTRASPPGMASSDGPRRDTYGAALQQFDDLMHAAAAIGPVSRPLPLYYAAHQAGKAVAAAWIAGDDWRVAGHGLAQDKADRDNPAWRADVLRFRVVPLSAAGVFGAVASLLGSPRLTGGVEMGALWSALPEVSLPSEDGRWLAALPVHPAQYVDMEQFTPKAFLGYVQLRGQPEMQDAAAIDALLARYPDCSGAKVLTGQVGMPYYQTPFGKAVGVMWPHPQVEPKYGSPKPPELIAAHVVNRVPVYARNGEHWLMPQIGDGADSLPPVLLWWVLLHGLSLLARYEPAAWRAALDLDASPIADPLTELLDQALVIVPDLLYDATTQGARQVS